MILTCNSANSNKLSLSGILLLLALCPTKALAQSHSPFDKAMQHIEQGQWQQASTLLHYQLELNPEHHRARLELAMVLLQLQQYQAAKQHLTDLLAVSKLPENVKFNINVMLTQLAQKTAQLEPVISNHDWQLNIAVESGYDSNVRFSFGDYFLEDDPYVDGTYFELPDGSILYFAPDGYVYDEQGNVFDAEALGIDFGPKQQDTSYLQTKFNLEHSFKRHTLTWSNRFRLQNSDNLEFSDYDKRLLNLQTKLNWQLSQSTELSITAQYRDLHRGGVKLLDSTSLTMGYSWLNQYGSFELYGQIMQRDFFDVEARRGDFDYYYQGFDNESFAIGANWSQFYFNKRLLSKINLEYKYNETSEDINYNGLIVKLASVFRATDKINVAGYVSYFKQDYDDPYYYGQLLDESMKLGVKVDYQLDDNKEIYFGLDRGFRDSDLYGHISSQKTNVKLGLSITFN